MEYINDKESIAAAQSGDEEALEKIVESNMGLVKSLALRFLGRGTEFEDLVQIGALGMVKAVKKFDLSLDLAFTTYAVPMIVGEIRRFLRDDGLIKVSRSVKQNCAKIYAFCQDYHNTHFTDPTVDMIAKETGISYEDVICALEANQPVLSLYEQNDESDYKLENLLGEDSMEESFDLLALEEAVSSLPPRDRELIRLRYYRGLTQTQTAKLLGVNQVKISREEKKICSKLRSLLG